MEQFVDNQGSDMLQIPVQDREESTWPRHRHKFPSAERIKHHKKDVSYLKVCEI